MHERMKHTIKDSVFTMLFREKENVLALYRSLHPEDEETTAEEIRTLTLETALVESVVNDLGLLVKETIILLVEAQSKFSRNLALRILLYLAETLSRYVQEHHLNLHSTKKVRIPRPELYVVYTGEGRVPPVIRLSELFADSVEDEEENAERLRELREKSGWIELEIRVLQRTDSGDILDQYVRFTEISNEMRRQYGKTVEAVRETIKKCLQEGVLTEFLSERQVEVESIMRYMLDQEEITRLREEEIRQDTTERVTKEVTDRVTKEVRKDTTEKVTEKNIQSAIRALKGILPGRERIVALIAETFGLQQEAAEEKVALYW